MLFKRSVYSQFTALVTFLVAHTAEKWEDIPSQKSGGSIPLNPGSGDYDMIVTWSCPVLGKYKYERF